MSAISNATPSPEIQQNVQQLFENLQGNQAISKYQLTMTKSMAAFYLWRLVLVSEMKKAEIVKVGSLPHLAKLAATGDESARYNAIGALLTLAASPEIREKMCDSQLVTACARCLGYGHDRTKANAAQLLALFGELSPLVPKLVPILKQVLEASGSSDPGWANGAASQACCLQVVRYIAVSPPGSAGLKDGQTWRPALLEVGAVPALVYAVEHGRLPDSRAHALVSLEALCSEKSVPEMLMQLNALPHFAKCLSDAHDESRAASASLLFTLSTELERMESLLPAIPALVSMLNPKVPEPEGKKKPKKKKAPALPPALAQGVRHATACLRHLSFLDDAKEDIVKCGAIPFVVKGLEFKKKGMDVEWFEYATGLLYNLAMMPEHTAALEEAKAPKYISKPLHERWQIFLQSAEEEEEEEQTPFKTPGGRGTPGVSKIAPSRPGFGSSAQREYARNTPVVSRTQKVKD
ncbi:hypothetical protein PPROV_000166000 [Pycnococcus provasolii]|uniref:Uncharacterized protein n=1 Tax=Pycnococcus provasolii TaxID=41880 RepID=A0A830H7B2_9CHLO|nr:hypothetical protein PPROV_000166000 [Pycnococcus provasolii]